jgi:hypothetical protein
MVFVLFGLGFFWWNRRDLYAFFFWLGMAFFCLGASIIGGTRMLIHFNDGTCQDFASRVVYRQADKREITQAEEDAFLAELDENSLDCAQRQRFSLLIDGVGIGLMTAFLINALNRTSSAADRRAMKILEGVRSEYVQQLTVLLASDEEDMTMPWRQMLDEPYRQIPWESILGLPLHCLLGISDDGADALNRTLGIRSIRDLSEAKPVLFALHLRLLSETSSVDDTDDASDPSQL